MDHIATGVIISIIGALIGAGIATFILARGLTSSVHHNVEKPEPTIPPGVAQVIRVLRSGGIVLGPHDEVLQSSAQSRTMGLVRGSRLLQSELLELAREVRADGQIRALEMELQRDAPTLLSIRVAPLDDGLVLILCEDRTAARRIDETRRDFVANVSHELKTPIGAISLLAEALQEAADDPEAVRRFTGRMQVETERLGLLVRQVIDLSALQAENAVQDPIEVKVSDLLGDAANRCRVAADRRDVSLTITEAEGLQVSGQAELLIVAIKNLIDNAIAYSDPGAKVVAAAREVTEGDEHFVDISVSDNGIGIPQGEVDRIFERFYRVDYARSRDNGGTGLGLAIVKHIVAAHGGQINVWSHVGQGSTFTIRLPAEQFEFDPRYDQVSSEPRSGSQEVHRS